MYMYFKTSCCNKPKINWTGVEWTDLSQVYRKVGHEMQIKTTHSQSVSQSVTHWVESNRIELHAVKLIWGGATPEQSNAMCIPQPKRNETKLS